MRPVVIDDRVLIDGGATNPLPFDLLRGRADVVLAVEISGPPDHSRTGVPNTIEAMYATVVLMTNSIIAEKLKHDAPDLLLQPNVGRFRTLDFFQASAILRIAEPIKAELKQKLTALLAEGDWPKAIPPSKSPSDSTHLTCYDRIARVWRRQIPC